MGIISISLDPFIVFSEKSQGPIIENSKKSSNVSIEYVTPFEGRVG